jgi:hypothetical protein
MLKNKNLTPSPSLFPILIEYDNGKREKVNSPSEVQTDKPYTVLAVNYTGNDLKLPILDKVYDKGNK